jgi:hypothetical protein
MMRLAVILTQRTKPNSTRLAEIEPSAITPGKMKKAFDEVWPKYESLGGDAVVAKGRDLVQSVFDLGKPTTKKLKRKKVTD